VQIGNLLSPGLPSAATEDHRNPTDSFASDADVSLAHAFPLVSEICREPVSMFRPPAPANCRPPSPAPWQEQTSPPACDLGFGLRGVQGLADRRGLLFV